MKNDKHYEYLPRTVRKNDSTKTVEIAEKILNDYFYESDFLDSFFMGEKYKNFSYIHSRAANSYQLYIHCLNVITFLCDAYVITKKTEYLDKAYNILFNWSCFERNNKPSDYKEMWCDHSASYRILNVLYLMAVTPKISFYKERLANKVVIQNLKYIDECKYLPNNHGLMIDKSMIVASFFIMNKNMQKYYYNKAYYRIREAFYRDFSRKGVHLENSPAYHAFVKKMFYEINFFLKSNNLSIGNDIVNFLKNDNYYSYLIKPNNNLPMIGDTGHTTISKIEKIYENFIDQEAGILIFQDEKSWLSFVCGYSNNNHKHYDDLSFNLFLLGEDIFIDSGKFNYDNNDPIRKYMLSTAAHNTITIGENYFIDNDKKPRIKSFYSNNIFDLVVAVNDCYKDGYHKRVLIFIKPYYVILFDDVNFNTDKKIIQNFNISPLLTSMKKSNKIKLVAKSGVNITVEQKLGNHFFDIIEGNIEKQEGLLSYNFNEVQEISQIQTEIRGNEAKFLTLIRSNEVDYELTNLKVSSDGTKISFTYNKENFCINV